MTNKKCMVFETLGNIQNMKVMENNSTTGEVRLQGVFGVCGIKNNNNRIYDKNNYSKMVEALQRTIMTEGCPGELEHPNSMNIDLNNVSHKIESIEIDENGTITGTILLLDTPKGKTAKAIVAGGLPLYISSRGAGNIDESGHVTLSMIKTYDLVGTPGFSQAKLQLKQNQTLEALNESAEDGNIAWMIVEGDDLLGDDDDKDKDKDKDKDSGEGDDKDKDNNGDNKDNSDDKSSDDKDKDNPDNNDNKNSDDNTTMQELKKAIDALTEKVTNLEAELHVAQESYKPINYDAIQTWVSEEFAENFKKTVSEMLDEKLTENKDGQMSKEDILEAVENWFIESMSPEIQNWICEEFAPEVQNWVCEEFAPEVQNWVCEEFAPEVQNWVCEEFAPEVQNWVTEEFAPVVEGWLNEEFIPENNDKLENKINENINTFMESQKNTKLSEIDAMIDTLTENKNAALDLLKEQKAADKYAGVYVVESMPAQYQPMWNTLSEARQMEIIRESKMYDFTKQGVLEGFWAGVKFEEKPVQVNENLNADPVQNRMNSIAQQMMNLRRVN